MKPIIYDSAETNFTTNGLGRLADAVSCIVTEQKNGAYILDLDYPVKGQHADKIKTGNIILATHDNTGRPQPFDIYDVNRATSGRLTVKARHISYRLSGIVAKPFGVVDLPPASYFQSLTENTIGASTFTYQTDVTTQGSLVETMDNMKFASIRALLGGDARTNFLNVYGANGEAFEWDFFVVKFLAHRGADHGVTFRRGRNVLELREETNDAELITACVPFYEGYDPITGDPVYVDLRPTYIVKGPYADSYPFQHTVPYDMSDVWEQPPLPSELQAGAEQWLAIQAVNKQRTRTTYQVDLTQDNEETGLLQTANLCDTVHLVDSVLDVSTSLEVVETRYDTLKERYTRMTIGDKAKTLNDAIKLQNAIYIEKIDAHTQQTSDLAKKTNVVRYVQPAQTSQNSANPSRLLRAATNAATTPEYDENGEEIEKIATINRQDIYAHKGGSGSGSGAKVLTFPKGTSFMNNKTSITVNAIHVKGLAGSPTLDAEAITITNIRVSTADDALLYVPNGTTEQAYRLYVQIQGTTPGISSGFSVYGTLDFVGTILNNRMQVKRTNELTFDLGASNAGGLYIAQVAQALDYNFYIPVTYA